MIKDITPGTPEYKRDYEKGWRYSQRPTATLDHADRINASHAWLDGYSDYACGNEKWHLMNQRKGLE